MGQKMRSKFVALVVLGCVLLTSCNFSINPDGGGSTTPTPTTMPGGDGMTLTEDPQNPCDGLSGTLELQLLVGPSEAVGLTPYTFATIPFVVVKEGEVYLVEGNGATEYFEEVLTAEWGSYTVQFEGETTVSGTCVANEAINALNVYLQMEGEQMVVVVVEEMELTYPWVGTPEVIASFPITDGAQVGGEGWNLVLHLE